MLTFCAFAAGLVFGLGLILSGMVNPAKVLGFLDVTGNWDPSLAFVMGGAIGVGVFAFAWARKRGVSLLGVVLERPGTEKINRRLLIGSSAFGVGWGLVGFCPGPALVALGMGQTKALVFVLAMLAGMKLFEMLEARRLAGRLDQA